MEIFARLESEVRSYVRAWPVVFERAHGHTLVAEGGREYLDFFSGAGTLNYGHNDPAMRRRLIAYLESEGISHSLDMATSAKRTFLERFEAVILAPRGLDYKLQFTGPTGANAVEAALKLARKVTGRQSVIAFTHSFHGMTLGALAVSGNARKRAGAGVPLAHAVSMPYDGFLGEQVDTTQYLETFLSAPGSGVDLPAAVIVETVQGEGGLHAASFEWLARLRDLCTRHDVLLIVDEIQTGCGRTGPFFSFEPAGITPDIVCLSKSLSGYGLPLALTLIRREIDVWEPGEHSGTFRGNNHAFITATEALCYWESETLSDGVQAKAEQVTAALRRIAARHPEARASLRGRGLIQGLACDVPGLAQATCSAAFERGLIVETSGAASEVVKLLPPLTIDEAALDEGLRLIEESLVAALDAGP